MLREEFINAKRIVIKLGTNVLRNSEGEVAISRIYSFIEDMAKLVKQGKEVILVTSGAVGLGTVLGWCVIPFIIPDLVKIALAFVLSRRVRKLVPMQ